MIHPPLLRFAHFPQRAACFGLVLALLGCNELEQAAEAEARAQQARQEALELELAAKAKLDAALAAEVEANEATAALLAERESMAERRQKLLDMEAAQLAQAEELRQRAARLAARDAEVAERERSLAVRQKQLDNVEANLDFQEKELARREREMTPTEPEPALEPAAEPESVETRQTSLQPGRLLEVEILETLSSRDSRIGDTFRGSLVQDLTAEDGTLVVPAGAEVIGRVIDVVPLKTVGGRASIDVEFTHLVLSPTETVAISASFVEVGADRRKDKKKIAGAAIVGAILGRVLGGDGEGLIAGAAAGAAAGTAAVARAKGKDAVIPAGTAVALQLDEVVTVSVEMTGPADG